MLHTVTICMTKAISLVLEITQLGSQLLRTAHDACAQTLCSAVVWEAAESAWAATWSRGKRGPNSTAAMTSVIAPPILAQRCRSL